MGIPYTSIEVGGGGAGSGTVGPGTVGAIAKFIGATTVDDSIITESGNDITLPGTLVVTQGTIVADAPQINASVTWNAAGIVGPAWKLNVTDTSSNAAAALLSLQVGAATKFDVNKSGALHLTNGTNAELVSNGSGFIVRNSSQNRVSLAFSGVVLQSVGTVAWTSGGDSDLAHDLEVTRDAANIHAWRRDTNANTGRIYNTFTSSTNYERFTVDWITTANVCLVGTEKGSGGGTARDMVLMTDAIERMRIAAGGEVTVKSLTATPAGGSTAARLVFGTTAGFGVYYGSGAPSVSAAQGSIYLRSDGSSTSTRLYVNTDGGTTWTNVTTAA